MYPLSRFCLALSVIVYQGSVLGSPAGFPVLPEIIRRAAADAGINVTHPHNYTAAGSSTASTFDIVPPDLADAYVRGDRKKIYAIKEQASKDLKPIFDNIAAVEDKAWTPIRDEPTGRTFWLTYAGDPMNPISYMWVFPSQVTLPDIEDKFSYSNVMQVGTLSRNTGYLGVSTQDWKEKATTDAVAAPFLVKAMSKFIKKRTAGAAGGTASEGAVAEAGDEVVAEGVASAVEVEALGSFMRLALTGGVAAVVVALLLYVLTDVLVREYKLSITVNNWSDQNDYVLTSYFGQNEAIDNLDTFKEAVLPRETTKIKFPGGFIANTTLQITRCNYNFVNSNQFLEGLSVAMEVEGPAGTGFRFKYDLSRFTKNLIALHTPIGAESLPAYISSKNYEPKGTYSVTKKMSDGTPVTAFTNDLSGRNDRFYEYTINIGQPFKIRDDGPPAPPAGQSGTLPQNLVRGDKIMLPDGTFALVGNEPNYNSHNTTKLPLTTINSSFANPDLQDITFS